MRCTNPSRRILMSKHDLDSAYRRLHWHAKCALLCITVVSNLAYLLTRLCFGIASGPSEWCVISETMVDIATILIEDKSWNPLTLFNPRKDIKVVPLFEDEDIPIQKAKEVIYKLPKKDTYIDGYIDDILSIVLDHDYLIPRGAHTVPLVCYIFFRPVHDNEPIERTDIISTSKLLAEGNLSEVKTFLGWVINTRKLRIFLPKMKALKWINEIDEILSLKVVKAKKLEKLIGKLNHAAFIIPLSRYFLNRLRHSQNLSEKFGPQSLSLGTKEDMEFFKEILSIMSTKGVSIPNVTHALPDYICWSDASSYGLGGFNHEGVAWQWKIPKHWKDKLSINLLEFIAAVITIMLSLKNKEKDQKILAFTDNSSALGWLHKASFHPASKMYHDIVAREFALFMMKEEHSLYSEHIKGDNNNVADTLSREFDLSKKKLTDLLYRSFPSQMPKSFTIIELPKEIVYWITSILDGKIVRKELKSKPHENHKHMSKSGKNFAPKRTLKINSWSQDLKASESKLCVPLQQPLEGITLAKLQKKFCSEIPSEIQSDMFVRTSGFKDSAIQELMNLGTQQ